MLRKTLFLTFFLCGASLWLQADDIKKPVLRIEEAMRVWQERWLAISGAGQPIGTRNPNGYRMGQSPDDIFNAPIEWPARKSDGQLPGPYPDECFYQEQLQQPNLAASLVANLRAKIATCLGASIAPTAGDLGGVILPFDPYWEILTPEPYGSAYGGTSIATYMVELADGNTVPVLRAPDASRMFKVYYKNEWVFPDVTKEPWKTMIDGSVTIENYEERFSQLVEFLQLPIRMNSYFTQVNSQDPLERHWTFDFYHPSIYRAECNSCETCQQQCRPGDLSCGDFNTHFAIGMGGSVDGSIGSFTVDIDTPDQNFASPRNLDVLFRAAVKPSDMVNFDNDADTYIITEFVNGFNQPRQIKIPSGLVDIIADSNNPDQGYTLYFYDENHIGTKVDGLFTVQTADAHTVIEVAGSGYNTTTKQLTVTRTPEDGNSEVTVFTFSESTNTWSYTQGTGDDLRTRSTQRKWVSGNGSSVGDVYQMTTQTTDSTGQLISKVQRQYKIFSWNASEEGTPFSSLGRRFELIETVVDPGGIDKRTSYYYDETDYGTFLSNQAVRRLQRVEYPDGSWQEYDFDTSARLSTSRSPFGSDSSTSGNHRITSFIFDKPSANVVLTEQTDTLQYAGSAFTVSRNWTQRELSGNYVILTSETATSESASFGDADNLRTISRSYFSGENKGRTERVINTDATVTLYSYSLDAQGQLTTVVESGVPDNLSDPMLATMVVDGQRTTTIKNKQGQVISRTSVDIASSLTTDSWFATTTDDHGRVLSSHYMDGTEDTYVYDCCGLEYYTDRSGLVTQYLYDSLHRIKEERTYPEGETNYYRHVGYSYDARDRRLTTTQYRSGTSLDTTLPESILLESRHYNLAGDLESVTTPLGTTSYAESFVNGTLQRTTTNPDLSTQIEIYDTSGQLVELAGTATAPMKYEVGVDAEGVYSKEIRIGDGGVESEWSKSYQDFAGRSTLVVLADDSRMESAYYPASESNNGRRGKLKQSIQPADSDDAGVQGVTMLYDYNSTGERFITAVDVDQNGSIDYTGSDRITKTESEMAEVTHDGVTKVVRRSTTSVWDEEAVDSSRVVSVSEQSVDGLYGWNTVNGLTTTSFKTIVNAINSTQTEVRADQTKTIRTLKAGRLLSTQTLTSADETLQWVTLSYDGYGRTEKSTDSWAGDTIYTYYSDGSVKTILTPDPDLAQSGEGLDPQLTQFYYDSMGRQELVVRPDDSRVEFRYNTRGLLWRTFGSGTYPQEMTYDAQGRLKTLATWQDFRDESSFESDTGKSVTTWNYDPSRGWLTSKQFNDGNGPTYSYYPSGKLKTRTWARGSETTYIYSTVGELLDVTYSDDTPDVSYTYTRLGQLHTSSDAAGLRTQTYTVEGFPDLESYDGNGLVPLSALDRSYDSLLRPTGFTLSQGGNAIAQPVWGYDNASRLETVTNGNVISTYSYVAQTIGLIDDLQNSVNGTTKLAVDYDHDLLGRMRQIQSTPSSDAAIRFVYAYNDLNQRVQAVREDLSFWSFDYDDLGQVVDASKFDPSSQLLPGFKFGFDYDTIGNRKTSTRTNPNTAISTSQQYTASLLNQYEDRTVPSHKEIIGKAASSSDIFVNGEETERTGELFFKQLNIDNTEASVWQPIETLALDYSTGVYEKNSGSVFVPQTPESYVYDLDGNLSQDGRWIYTWDAENRLIAMETIPAAVVAGAPQLKLEFAYDASSRRIQKQVFEWNSGSSDWDLVKDTRFLWDGWNLVAELDALDSNAVLNTFTWGLDLSGSLQGAGGVGGLLYFDSGTEIHFAAYDGNGNVAALIEDSGGTIAAEYEYGPFGQLIRSSGDFAQENPFRFSTKYTDSETGLCYYGYRFYDPELGWFINRDPIEEVGGVNLYGFVGNDAANKWDLLGLSPTRFRTSDRRITKFKIAITPANKPWDAAKANAVYADMMGKHIDNTIQFIIGQALKKAGPYGPIISDVFGQLVDINIFDQIFQNLHSGLGYISRKNVGSWFYSVIEWEQQKRNLLGFCVWKEQPESVELVPSNISGDIWYHFTLEDFASDAYARAQFNRTVSRQIINILKE